MNPILAAERVALVTGASSGIGAEYARALARYKMTVILVARSAEKLAEIAAEVERLGGKAVVVPTDLTAPGSCASLVETLANRRLTVDLLINNAGFGIYGRFGELPLERQLEEIQLNVTALIELTHRLLPGMLRGKRGAVVNVASTAAFQPLPYMAIYGATKAFVVSFSEALGAEYAAQGLYVQALCPGNTETPFHANVGSSNGRVGGTRTPEQVVATSLKAFPRRKAVVIDGTANALTALLPRLLPRWMTTRITTQLLAPRP